MTVWLYAKWAWGYCHVITPHLQHAYSSRPGTVDHGPVIEVWEMGVGQMDRPLFRSRQRSQ